jgi:hypothetical protein
MCPSLPLHRGLDHHHMPGPVKRYPATDPWPCETQVSSERLTCWSIKRLQPDDSPRINGASGGRLVVVRSLVGHMRRQYQKYGVCVQVRPLPKQHSYG